MLASWEEKVATRRRRATRAAAQSHHGDGRAQERMTDSWGLAGAVAVLELRALTDNGDLPKYWPYHLAREHERLYPTPDQHRYQLTA